jgi:protein SCO1
VSLHLSRTARILASVGFAALALAGVSAFQLSRLEGASFNGTAYPDAPAAPEIALTDHHGEARSLSDFRGRTALVFFGFTNCPDVCPLTLAKLQRILHESELTREEVAVLFVSVDPETDTPAVMRSYAEGVGPNIVGLTGTREEIDRVMAAYGVFAEQMAGHHGGQALAHTPLAFGIDAQGRLRVLIHPEESTETVEEDIQELVSLSD